MLKRFLENKKTKYLSKNLFHISTTISGIRVCVDMATSLFIKGNRGAWEMCPEAEPPKYTVDQFIAH